MSVHSVLGDTLSRIGMHKDCGSGGDETSPNMQERMENLGGQPRALHDHVL